MKKYQIYKLKKKCTTCKFGILYVRKSFTEPTPSSRLEATGILGRYCRINNWLTCVYSNGKPLIVNAHKLKFWKQRFNNGKSRIQSERAKLKIPQGFSSVRLQNFSEARAIRRMRDAEKKAVITIIDCSENYQVSVTVFGWNKVQN